MVLDRSGSMEQVKSDVVGGVNTLIIEQRIAPGDCTMTLLQFDTILEYVFQNQNILQVPPLTDTSFQPRGSTALLDAIGKTVTEAGDYLKSLKETERPEKVVCVIVTDGLENASRKFTREQIFEMIKHQREMYQWEFVFIGANQDAIAAGRSIGSPAANNMTYDHSPVGTQAVFAATSSNLRSFRSGHAVNMAYSTAQREEQENLLKAKGKK